jgi:hypothetical protein
MSRLIQFLIYLFCTLCYSNLSVGQENKTVIWQWQADPSVNSETVIRFTAHVAQGWHLYSQHVPEGGPMPTRFSFDNGDDYIMVNQMKENGNAIKFHDDTYEMEIIWFTGVVFFEQRVKLTPQATQAKGTIEFMSCNDHTCIPGKQKFSIDLRKKIP